MSKHYYNMYSAMSYIHFAVLHFPNLIYNLKNTGMFNHINTFTNASKDGIGLGKIDIWHNHEVHWALLDNLNCNSHDL